MKIDKELFQESQESGQYLNIKVGAYIARVTAVEDVEEKQYIKVYFDLVGSEPDKKEYKDYFKKQHDSNTDTNKKAWPHQATLYKSYKPSAYPFLKSFTTALEKSNSGYSFEKTNFDHTLWVGKLMVVVFGEEETDFINEDTNEMVIQTRVQEVRSIQALQEGKIKTPERKLLSDDKREAVQKVIDSKNSNKPSADNPFNDEDNNPFVATGATIVSEDLPF